MLGAALNVAAVARYVHLLRRLARGDKLRRPSTIALTLGGVLAAIGGAVSFYLMRSW